MPASLIIAAIALQVATEPQVQIGPFGPPRQTLQLPTGSPPDTPAKPPERAEPSRPRVPIDLGEDPWPKEPPQQIDILAPAPEMEAPTPSVVKECKDQQERGIVSGEIVVCAELEQDTSQLYSGSREAWMKDYAERTQNVGTIPPPDVAGPGIFRGPPTVSGLCFVGPCPKDPALMIDVKAIPDAPAGSDADRVAKGLKPREDDTAPVDEDARKKIDAELGLPEVPSKDPEPGSKPRSP